MTEGSGLACRSRVAEYRHQRCAGIAVPDRARAVLPATGTSSRPLVVVLFY